MTLPEPKITEELVKKYDRAGPRYTSYPTAPIWSKEFGDNEWDAVLDVANGESNRSLALYVHLPFCSERCLFCACNVVITKRSDILTEYLSRLHAEIDRTANKLPDRRKIMGLHWGGGTPTHLSVSEIEALMAHITDRFELQEGAEVSIEVHPPVTTKEQMETLARLGFNRLSLGVQDIDEEVQRLINRNQTIQQTEQILTWARGLGFRSVNFDLVYGLPGQTTETWNRTLDEVLRLLPDRLAIYSYAHVPWLHPQQKRMPEDRMPTPERKLEFLSTASRRLSEEGGYQEIGFDHFALPSDELAKAVQERHLYRNFMGYTVKPAEDYIGFGMTAISEVGNAFAQNQTKINAWSQAVDEERSTVCKGHALDLDDQLRKLVIERLMCNQQLEHSEFEELASVPFREYFSEQWPVLLSMETDGLIALETGRLTVTEQGRRFLRNICMLFDRYLDGQEKRGRFSRTV